MATTGSLKTFMDGKGLGFIQRDDGQSDVCFHVRQLTNGGLDDMKIGTRFSFDIEADETGRRQAAVNVTITQPGSGPAPSGGASAGGSMPRNGSLRGACTRNIRKLSHHGADGSGGFGGQVCGPAAVARSALPTIEEEPGESVFMVRRRGGFLEEFENETIEGSGVDLPPKVEDVPTSIGIIQLCSNWPVLSGATTGTVAGTAAGGTFGLAAGAVVSVPLACITFGLALPLGAAMGGLAGACAGGVTGGAVGASIGYLIGRGRSCSR